eukprot:5229386-Pleurochrysis_carterae.AAC.1
MSPGKFIEGNKVIQYLRCAPGPLLSVLCVLHASLARQVMQMRPSFPSPSLLRPGRRSRQE